MKFNIISKLCLMALAVLPLSISAQTTKLSIESFNIKAGETKTMTIDLDNPDMEVTLVQFDLYLPDGLFIAVDEDGEYVTEITRTTYKKHSFDANALDGYTRFLLSSSKNSTLSGTSGAFAMIDLTAASTFTSGMIALKDILIVAPDAEATTVKPANIELKVGDNTAVEGITVDEKLSVDIYDLSGRRIRTNASSMEGLSKGIYLMNGKKVVKN